MTYAFINDKESKLTKQKTILALGTISLVCTFSPIDVSLILEILCQEELILMDQGAFQFATRGLSIIGK